MKINAAKSYTEEEAKFAFPDVDAGCKPFGSRVLVQVRTAKSVTKGGIILSDDNKETEKWNTQIGKVRALGPVAFCNRETLQPWPEGAWAQVGDYVRIPKFNQDRWEVETFCGEKSFTGQEVPTQILFMFINDLDLIGKIICNPLDIKAYI